MIERKTEKLRKIITAQLDTVSGETYYRKADEKAEFPYKVFSFRSIDLSNEGMDAHILTVDIWDRSEDPKRADAMADALEQQLDIANVPTGGLLPTFYRLNRNPIEDDDKGIQRVQLEFAIRTYYMEV